MVASGVFLGDQISTVPCFQAVAAGSGWELIEWKPERRGGSRRFETGSYLVAA